MTSHDVVQQLRRIFKEKRIGHTGTLDPMATGVLVLCIGKATRIARCLEAGEKEYRAVMRLGVTTDTLDAEGRITEVKTYRAPDRGTILRVMRQFVGRIMQRPPAFSAVKIAGVPSYKLARQGKAEPNKPRQVMIHKIELTDYEDPFLSFTARCDKGVYIRSLCADIGDALSTGGHLTSLQRTRSGRFTLDTSVTVEEIALRAADGTVGNVMSTIDDALAEFTIIRLTDKEAARVIHGNKILCPSPEAGLETKGALVRLHDSSGQLLALARLDGGVIQPESVFSRQ